MRKSTPVFFLVFISIVLIHFNSFAAMIMQKPAEGSGDALPAEEIIEKPNPHLELKCLKCHDKRKKEKGKVFKQIGPVSNVDKVCNKCHKGSNLHPVNIDPKKSSLKMTPPPFLPLGKRKYKRKMVCTTCHDVHLKTSGFYLLRGFPGTKSERKAKFQRVNDLCKSCHGDKLIEMSLHGGKEKNCKFCHETDPNEAEDPMETVRVDSIKRCNLCHARLSLGHSDKIDKFKEKIKEEKLTDVGLPLIEGEITCVACHDQHWKSTFKYKLRQAYVDFVEKYMIINPHWTGTFCLTCHDKVPEKEKEEKEGKGKIKGKGKGKEEGVTFLFDGDIIKVCNRCHEGNEEVASETHPVGIRVPEAMKNDIPRNFKLKEVKEVKEGERGERYNIITCITCHDLILQTKVDKEKKRRNPLFLRGGPYRDRSAICYKCHKKETYTRTSPHKQQKDSKGNIIEEKCTFCHDFMPDVDTVKSIDDIQFSGEVTEYCHGCHSDKVEKHPASVNHDNILPSQKRLNCIEEAEAKLKIIFPLYNGVVFCATCHNPHEKGVLKGAAASGAGTPKFLRLKGAMTVCIGCHCDKGQTIDSLLDPAGMGGMMK
jgi:hypothetical protein